MLTFDYGGSVYPPARSFGYGSSLILMDIRTGGRSWCSEGLRLLGLEYEKDELALETPLRATHKDLPTVALCLDPWQCGRRFHDIG